MELNVYMSCFTHSLTNYHGYCSWPNALKQTLKQVLWTATGTQMGFNETNEAHVFT